MTIELQIVCAALCAHFVADFIFQTDDMAIKKSSDNFWLTMHVLTYTGVLCVVGLLIGLGTSIAGPGVWVLWAIVNGVIHFGVDYVTSRWSSALSKANRRGDFFKVIGFDQLLHGLTLVATLSFIVF